MKQKDFLSCSVRNCRSSAHTVNSKCEEVYLTHPLISELRESVHNDTKHDVQSNGCDDDEE